MARAALGYTFMLVAVVVCGASIYTLFTTDSPIRAFMPLVALVSGGFAVAFVVGLAKGTVRFDRAFSEAAATSAAPVEWTRRETMVTAVLGVTFVACLVWFVALT